MTEPQTSSPHSSLSPEAAQEMLRELEASREMYSDLYDRAPIGYLTLGETGRILKANLTAAERLGAERNDLIGQPLSRFVHPDDQDVYNQCFRHLLAQHAAQVCEFKMARLDTGGIFWARFEAIPKPAATGELEWRAVLSDITERKKSEEELRRSQKLLQTIIDSTPDWIFIKDREHRFQLVNQSIARALNTTPEGMLGKNDLELGMPPDIVLGNPEAGIRGFWADDLEIFATGQPKTIPDEPTILDDKLRHLHTVKLPTWDESGAVSGVLGFVHDITELKETEQRLRVAEQFTQATLDALSAQICVLDEAGVLLAVNRSWRDFGAANPPAPPGDCVGMNYLHVCEMARGIGSSEAAPFATGLREVLARRLDGFTLKYPCHAPDQKRWFQARVTRFPGEAGAMAVVAHENITERKLAEAELRMQSAALNAANDAIVITDRDGTIQWINQACTALSGYEAEEAIGRNPRELFRSGVQDQAFYKRMWDTLLSGSPWHGEMTNRRKDGSHYIEEQSITPVKDAEGQVTHFIGIKRDLTETKQMQERLLQSQKLESIGLLAGGIAHEFNNQIAIINGTAELASMSLSESDPLQVDLQQIQRAGDHAATLTRQLLAFSRKQLLQPKRLDLNRVITEAVPRLERLLGAKVHLLVHRSPGLGLVFADPAQLQQALVNLALNASDAMPEGGTLSLSTERLDLTEPHFLSTGVLPVGSYAVLSVEDTGVGISASVRPRLFEPFFTTKPFGQATGLGLATVWGIVQQSGGHVDVSSEPGHGATFRIFLTRLADEPDA